MPWLPGHVNCEIGSPSIRAAEPLGALDHISWEAVNATNFRDPVTRDAKQAELLVHESFPWELIETIGVLNPSVRRRVETGLRGAAHRPAIQVQRSWYY